MIPQKLDQKYAALRPILQALKEHVSGTLGAFADERGFPFYGRLKSAESLSEKIETGRYRKFSEIEDLVAFTLIMPNATYESEVVAFCRSAFELVDIRDRSTAQKPPDTFRFDCTRVLCGLRRPPYADPVAPSIYDHRFELQIRTAFEHAWVVSTHDLTYKGSATEWKRIRLAAQLKATAESMDVAIASFEHMASAINESPWKRINDQTEASRRIKSLIDARKILEIHHPDSLMRFSDNFCKLIASIRPAISVEAALDLICAQLPEPAAIPKSLSFYQVCLGILCSRLPVRSVEATCHVTDELRALYPETKSLQGLFDYES
ncbi:hypothetical protein [Bradyrhizobium sp. CCBAU 21360]|uniref:hypothetical protein n=1 Tax=Bradyrhizobium sp. CCBAU 21360 TaxID=1325081 RepID=UPI0023050123|nr:hypothetical protein [Bradyrhizobium sp. CCBAU 21360]MDA9452316.1 hypothetical protein [Bradyrhizobium sp. CCBAU 21360]